MKNPSFSVLCLTHDSYCFINKKSTNHQYLYYSSIPPTLLSKIIHACCFWFIQSLWGVLLCFLFAHCHLKDINHAYCVLRKHIYLCMHCAKAIDILVEEKMWAGSTHMGYSELFSMLVQGSCIREIQRRGFSVCKICCGDLGGNGMGVGTWAKIRCIPSVCS